MILVKKDGGLKDVFISLHDLVFVLLLKNIKCIKNN